MLHDLQLTSLTFQCLVQLCEVCLVNPQICNLEITNVVPCFPHQPGHYTSAFCSKPDSLRASDGTQWSHTVSHSLVSKLKGHFHLLVNNATKPVSAAYFFSLSAFRTLCEGWNVWIKCLSHPPYTEAELFFSSFANTCPSSISCLFFYFLSHPMEDMLQVAIGMTAHISTVL